MHPARNNCLGPNLNCTSLCECECKIYCLYSYHCCYSLLLCTFLVMWFVSIWLSCIWCWSEPDREKQIAFAQNTFALTANWLSKDKYYMVVQIWMFHEVVEQIVCTTGTNLQHHTTRDELYCWLSGNTMSVGETSGRKQKVRSAHWTIPTQTLAKISEMLSTVEEHDLNINQLKQKRSALSEKRELLKKIGQWVIRERSRWGTSRRDWTIRCGSWENWVSDFWGW